jgi:nucleoside-triphosphatase
MHLLITGKPSCGKTTLIKELAKIIPKKRGFFTEEIRENQERVGFKVVTFKGEETVFAHKDFHTPFKVSKYKIDIEAFNKVAVKELKESIKDTSLVIIDELGKMELFSKEFKEVVEEVFEKKKVLGTISLFKDPFLEKIKEREDVYVLNLSRENYKEIKKEAELILKSLSKERIRFLEKKAKDLGLEERILIENASSNMFEIIEHLNLGKKVLVIAGKGNNGADVLSCARKLFSKNYQVKVVVLEEEKENEEVVFQKEILKKLNVSIYSLKEEELIKNSDFILEGILGIGMRGKLTDFLEKIIDLINESKKVIISCDIPSGLLADEGIPSPVAVKAAYTITFISPKEGFFKKQGRQFCGKIFVADIGIGREALEKDL